MTTIAIIGRANVGKSTLFNRLAEKRQALVSDVPGTTRDLKYAQISWQGRQFELIDTGGFLADQDKPLKHLTKKERKKFKRQAADDIDKQVEAQARLALGKAQIILFITDGKQGLNPQDREIADYLRKVENKQIILVVNKCDNLKIRQQTAEFYQLGLGEPALVSAANGSGTGDLLDRIVSNQTAAETISDHPSQSEVIRVAIVGKPNVGKSSLLNSILGEDKAIVSPIPHTTREPNDILINFEGRPILLIDTAGIRRKARVESGLEKLGVSMSISAFRQSDIILLMVDLSKTISKQDLKIGQLLADTKAGVIIVANKYDLAMKALKHENIKTLKQPGFNLDDEKDNGQGDLAGDYKQYIYHNFPHLAWAPIVFASAKTGWNVQKILKLILEVEDRKKVELSDSGLNRFLKSIISHQPPPRRREGDGRKMKIKRAFITRLEQIDVNPPVFKCAIDSKDPLPESYRQYMVNQLRKKFGFEGVPVKLVIESLNH